MSGNIPESQLNVNLNQVVRFRLTKRGVDIVLADQYTYRYCNSIKPTRDEQTNELWVFMSQFGEHLHNRHRPVTEEDSFEIVRDS